MRKKCGWTDMSGNGNDGGKDDGAMAKRFGVVCKGGGGNSGTANGGSGNSGTGGSGNGNNGSGGGSQGGSPRGG